MLNCPSIPASAKVLVICEKPSVARDMAKVLGGGTAKPQGDYIEFDGGTVSWAVGHLLELAQPVSYNPEWKEWKWEGLPMVPDKLAFKSEPKEGMQARLASLRQLYQKADIIVNACDAGREGELIWWEIMKYCGWGKPGPYLGEKQTMRFWAQSNTEQGIKEAWEAMKPVSAWLGLASAAYSRNEADWLLGLNATRASTLCFPPPVVDNKRLVWTVGRVQTPVLALMVERDLEILNFVSRPFFEVKATFQGESSFEATLLVPKGVAPFIADDTNPPKEVKSFLNKADADTALQRVLATKPQDWKVEDESKASTENPPVLFSLTDLQKWCNQAWGWEAKRTLDAAQAAYETDKTLSYPRTDAAFLPEDKKAEIDEVFAQLKAQFLDSRMTLSGLALPSISARGDFLFDNSKLTDHYAIVPTGEIPSNLGSDSGMVWLAVVRRFFVAFSDPAKVLSLKRKLTFGADVAVASGKRYESRGWLALDAQLCSLTRSTPKSEPDSLPACGPAVPVLSGKLHEGKTTPPKAYTEATLLGVMENIQNRMGEEQELKDAIAQKGLGTPATRAAIIELLIKRAYLTRVEKGKTVHICSTDIGRDLIAALKKADLEFLTSPVMTAEWEQRLLCMERGSSDTRDKFLGDLLEVITDVLTKLKATAQRTGTFVAVKKLDVLCPRSNQPVLDAGKFWTFAGFPGVRAYKLIAGRTFTVEEMIQVLQGNSPLFSGFLSTKGAAFSAKLLLNKENKFDFSFDMDKTALSICCPVSNKPVLDCGKYWQFEGFKDLRVYKEIAGRPMQVEEIVKVLSGASPVFEGFTSSKGSKFSASLVFDPKEKKITFKFNNDAPRTAKAMDVVCPLTGEPVRDAGGIWEIPGKPGVQFWKKMASRPMELKDYLKLVEDGKSGLIKGFTSQAGKKFDAFLVIKDGKVGFDFPPKK